MSDEVLVQHCKVVDYNATTGECYAPFYGPASSFPPALDAAEALMICATIVSCWGVGFYIKQARRAALSY